MPPRLLCSNSFILITSVFNNFWYLLNYQQIQYGIEKQAITRD